MSRANPPEPCPDPEDVLEPSSLAALCHDLMNPVAAILGFVEIAQLRADTETIDNALEQINAAARKLEARIMEISPDSAVSPTRTTRHETP